MLIVNFCCSNPDKSRGTCNFLNLIYDPVSVAGRGPVGDLSARLGPVPVGKLHVRHDPALETIEPGLLNSLRSLYFVIFDHKHPDSYLSCSKLRLIEPSIAKLVENLNIPRDFIIHLSPLVFYIILIILDNKYIYLIVIIKILVV